MASNGNGNHYSNLPKKELQNLCKRHGLPTNRSKSDLASSLAPYLQAPMPLEDSSAGIIRKDSSFANDDGTKNVFINGIGTSDAKISPAKEDYGSLAKTSEEAPHPYMEFHMWDDKGINLVVDLEASPLSWTKMFKHESAEPVCRTMPHSPKEDFICLDENGKDIIDVDGVDDKLTGYNQQEGDKSLVSSVQKSGGTNTGASLPPLGSIGGENGGLQHLIELTLDSNGNSIPSIGEECGAGKYERTESLKCSQLDNSVERMRSQCLESEEVPDRKRKYVDAADQCGDDNSAPMIVVYRRRSSRLKSKLQGLLQK